MKTKQFSILFLTGFLALAVLVTSSLGQSQRNQRGEPAETKSKSPVTAIVGGDVYTVTGETIRGGTVLVQDGKILEVGQDITIPENATRIDATGKVVTPGFVAISMNGIGVGQTPQNNDKLADTLDPYDRNMKYSLGVGITTGCVELTSRRGRGRRRRDGEPEQRFLGLEPEPQQFVSEAQMDYGDEDTALCPCCGLPILPTEPITETPPAEAQPRKLAVLKMSYGHLDSMLVKENVFYSPNPGSLAGALNRHNWRRDVKQAKQMVERNANGSSRQNADDASSRRPGTESTDGGRGRRGAAGRSRTARPGAAGNIDENLLRLVRKEIPLRVQANTVDEIRDMIALARELDYNLVIEGAIEAWLVARELGEASVSVIYTPRSRREPQPGREKNSGSSIESTGIFEQSGVPFATAALSNSISMGGIAGRDLSSLPLEAAFAVRGGASNDRALESLTIEPARMLGLNDRIGSIEKGKDADLLILNGPPLDYRSYVEVAMVDGNVCYHREKDRVFPVFERK